MFLLLLKVMQTSLLINFKNLASCGVFSNFLNNVLYANTGGIGDSESREIITNILTKKFKYQNQESNYTNETLDLDMDNPDDYNFYISLVLQNYHLQNLKIQIYY